MAAKDDGAPGKPSRRTGRQGQRDQGGDVALSRERIATVAVELLDAHGVGRLTMRGLADGLGAGAMSLYWHVDNKEDVFDLALDAVFAYRGPPQTEEPQGWRAEIVHVLEDWRAGMLRHPWSASLLPRRALGPNILVRLELLGRSLLQAGVAEADLNVAIWSLWNYVMGATVTRSSFVLSETDRTAAQQRLAGLGARYPTIDRSRLLLDEDWDGVFRKGLDFLLDGLVPG
jgi:AcrR family transcriptional regulator